MSARRVQGDMGLLFSSVVATAQAVEVFDLLSFTIAGNTCVRAQDQAWATAVATPTSVTATNGAVAMGTSLTNALTAVKISYQFPFGEGPLSAASTATPTAGAQIKLTGASLTPPAPALWTNIYVETSAGSGVYGLSGRLPLGQPPEFYVSSYGSAVIPSASPVTATALAITQYNFAQTFHGVSNQRKIANLARIFGSSADNQIMVCRKGCFEFDCASATFTQGQFVGPDKDVGNNLLNQQVVLVPDQSMSIGRVIYQNPALLTKVTVDICSTFAVQPAVDSGLNSPGNYP